MARGRAPNLSLPPTRQLANQRDYRARKAQYISGLEEKVKTLEGRVEDLEAELLQARLGGGATGMGSKEASELRSALLQSLALVNHAYPQREHRAERLASTSSTPASLPESPPLSIPSPAYPPPSTLHRQPSFSPHHQQQQQQQQQQYHPEPGPSTYFSQPQQFGSPFATSHANERKGGGSISTQASASSSSSQHSQDHQLGLIEDPSCCAGIFDCSPFPSTSTNSTSTPTIVTSSSFPSPPLPVGAGGPSPPQQQQQQQQQHHQVNNGKPSSSSSSTNSGCCPPNQPQQPQAQPQPQQQQPSSSLIQQPQPLQLSHLTQQQQQQLHHLAQQQQQQQQHLRNQQQQHVLQHPLLLLAQTSVMGDEEVCCDVETAMRDGCAPLANGGWAKAVGMQHGMAVGAGGGMQQSMRS